MTLSRRGFLASAGAATVGGSVVLSTPAAHAADRRVTIDPQSAGVVWEGFGTALAWSSYRLGGAADAVRNRYADLLFDRRQGLGLTIVRYNIGGGENPAYPDHMELRARIPGWQPVEGGPYDWSADPTQRWMLRAAKARVPADEFIAESFANSAPWWMTISGSVTGGRDAAENLDPAYYEAFARYLVDVNEHLRTADGIDFRTLSPVNEPSAEYWTFGNRQEGCRFFPPAQARMIAATHAELRRRGSATTVSGSEETSIDVGRDTVNSWSDTTRDQLSQFNVHSYSGSDRTGFLNAARGKKIWMSEHGNGDATGQTLSQNVLWDVKWLKASAFVYWQAVDFAGWGMIDTELNDPDNDFTDYTVNKKFWAMAQWSRYVRPGCRVIEVGDNDTVAFHDADAGQVIIVSVNNTDAGYDVDYDVSGFAADGAEVTGVATGPDRDLDPIAARPLAEGRFTGRAAAGTTTTWVVTGLRPRYRRERPGRRT